MKTPSLSSDSRSAASARRAGVRAGALFLVALLLPAGWADRSARAADGSRDPEKAAFFEARIRPVLSEQCYSCHSTQSGKAKGGLKLDTRDATRAGGDSGPAVVPSEPAKSLLLSSIRHEGELEMPQKAAKLPDTVIADFQKWIADGAVDPREAATATSAAKPKDDGRAHWAFRPPVRPSLPEVHDASRVRTPVDRFVLARLEAEHRTYAEQADKRTLLRRITFDLTGLPPTPDEIAAFKGDDRPDAYERVVEKLLASSAYGERWGRHWLDVAGWSESSLLISDRLRQGFWRYRDYVIKAFNDDKPFDQFVVEQLAGDELVDWQRASSLTPDMVEKLTATGFLRCVPDGTDNQPITQDEKRFATQQQTVEVAIKALQGLTFNCVRCHDHKFDPISQQEYYQVVANFGAAYDVNQWLGGIQYKLAVGPMRAVALLDRERRLAFEQHLRDVHARCEQMEFDQRYGLEYRYRDQVIRDRLADLPAEIDRKVVLAALAVPARQRSADEQQVLLRASADLNLTLSQLQKQFPQLQKEILGQQQQLKTYREEELEKLPEVVWCLWDVSTKPSPTPLLQRGDFQRPGDAVQPGVIRVLDDSAHPFAGPTPPADGHSTGRRLALARWMTRPNHPLTARVMVNRIWQYHFGDGLVVTPDDFGRRGAKPTHPELLDWLATTFVEQGWSIKAIHRLIVLSDAYRQAGTTDSPEPAMDRSLLHGFPVKRLEAEAIRDAMLSAAGLLDRQAGGPSVETSEAEDGSYAVALDNPGRHRRSVYLSTVRTQLPSLLALFDAPAMDTNWPRRNDSATPTQSLALMNHPEVLEAADALAKRVCRERTTDDERLTLMFELTLGRDPDGAERSGLAGKKQSQDWTRIAHALISCNEFLYPS